MTVSERVRAFVEEKLPWFDPVVERARNARTEARRLRDDTEREKVKAILADYQETDDYIILARRPK